MIRKLLLVGALTAGLMGLGAPIASADWGQQTFSWSYGLPTKRSSWSATGFYDTSAGAYYAGAWWTDGKVYTTHFIYKFYNASGGVICSFTEDLKQRSAHTCKGSVHHTTLSVDSGGDGVGPHVVRFDY